MYDVELTFFLANVKVLIRFVGEETGCTEKGICAQVRDIRVGYVDRNQKTILEVRFNLSPIVKSLLKGKF